MLHTPLTDQPTQLMPEFYDEAQRLRNKLAYWRFRTWASITIDPRERLEGVAEPRITQMGLPLLAVLPPEVPALRQDLLAYLRACSEAVQAERGVHWEGLVLGVLYAKWRDQTIAQAAGRPGSPDRVLIKDLVSTLRADALPTATSKSVAQTLRKTFRFQTATRGGNTTVILDPKLLDRHARKYGISIDDSPKPIVATGLTPTTVAANGATPSATSRAMRRAMR
jgi:hypothetical protein